MIAEEIERQVRRTLWINHGCPTAALYGDDGEMQCNTVGCSTDFKRKPLAELVLFLWALGRLHCGKTPLDSLPDVKRYDHDGLDMELADDGEWVKWQIMQAHVCRLLESVIRLTQQIAAMRHENDGR